MNLAIKESGYHGCKWMPLFKWTCSTGETGRGDVLPVGETFDSIIELELTRYLGNRTSQSHPEHESAMTTLPPGLLILRANGCRIRQFPVLPVSILEVYFKQNDIIRLPPLHHLMNCIVLEFGDNRIEEIDCGRLPPRLARLGMEINALGIIRGTLPHTCLNWDFTKNPSHCVSDNPYYLTSRRLWFIYNNVEDAVQAVREMRPINPYTNGQSVHNTSIQESAITNLAYIVNYCPEIPQNMNLVTTINRAYSKLLTTIGITGHLPGSMLRSYLEGTYSRCGVTLQQLVDRLWLRITHTTGDIQKELMRRFQEEVTDGVGMCSNGMFTRLTNNVLLGFDENIRVRMSNNEILTSRIPQTMERLRRELDVSGEEPIKYWVAVYKQTVRDLVELEEPRESWQPWLEPITDAFAEKLLEDDAIAEEIRPLLLQRDNDTNYITTVLQKHKLLGLPWEITILRARCLS